jgi:hypothetical protein
MVFSPSGTLMAYQSDESGRPEVYVTPVPGPGPRVPVSIDRGTAPVWSRDGRTLYFRSDQHIMSASITETPSLSVTRRDSLFSMSMVSDGLNLDVMPGGRGFVTVLGRDARSDSPFRLAVISNWQSQFAKPTAAATTR